MKEEPGEEGTAQKERLVRESSWRSGGDRSRNSCRTRWPCSCLLRFARVRMRDREREGLFLSPNFESRENGKAVVQFMVRNLGRFGYDSAESYPPRRWPHRFRYLIQYTHKLGKSENLGSESKNLRGANSIKGKTGLHVFTIFSLTSQQQTKKISEQ